MRTPTLRTRRRLAIGAVLGVIATLGATAAVLAVHDESFQLEGNAKATDLSFTDIDKSGNTTTLTPGTLQPPYDGPYDWDSLFTISGTPAAGNADGAVTGTKSPLPGDFTAASFVKDFKNTGTTFVTSDDTTFATGSKDTLPISGWQCNQDNNVNSKTDIVNGFAAIEEHNGNKILFFGLEKDVNNGDNNVGFWLLQDGTVNCASTGSAVTFSGAHVEGDLFVVSAFTNGGGVSSVTVYQWVNDADPNKAGNQPGIDPNPILVGADCLDTPADGTADKACAVVNGKDISMPWLSADGGVVNAVKKSPNFFEGAINLTEFSQFTNRCFSDYILNTRSSQELGATLFDFVRGDLSTCRPSLSIAKTPDSGTYFAGEGFNWTVDVTNTGNGAATNAVVTDTVPAGLTIGSPTYDADPNTAGGAGACSVSGQTVTCTIPSIAASDGNTTGEEPDVARITIPVTVTSGVFGASTDGCVAVNNTATVTLGTFSASDNGAVNACRLTVTKDATPAFTRTYTWTIDKSVDPASHKLFDGQTGDSTYTITVDKTTTDSAWAVSGTITIANPAAKAAMLTSVTDSMTGPVNATVDCAGKTSVPANSSIACTYSSALADATSRTNTASVVAYGITYTGTAAVDFSGVTPTTVGPASVNVDDTYAGGDKGPIADDTTYTYKRTFDCSDIAYDGLSGSKTVPNTATITETGAKDDASVGVTCYRLGVSKTAAPAFTRTYDWTIDKSVDPASHDLFDGQSAESTYTIKVGKTTTDSAWNVGGTITISNPAPMAATVTSVTDDISNLAGDPTPDCPSATVPAGGTLVCSYSSDLPDTTTRTNTATATAYGVDYTGDAAIDFSSVSPTISGPTSVSVDDTFDGGDKTGITDSTEYTYKHTFDCSDITYKDGSGSKTVPNTAKITETGAKDSASVDVTCYRLSVEKTASPAFTRTYDWTIDKSVDPASHVLFDGQSADSTYTIKVDKTTTDSAWAVDGTITVHNPAPMDATVTSLTDDISNLAGDPTPDCPSTTVPAGGTLVCSYSSALPDATSRTNTATATAYGVDYSGDAAIDFSAVEPKVVGPASISVDDTFDGGDKSGISESTSYTYARTFDCSTVTYDGLSGSTTVPNTAKITETGAKDSASVDVTCYKLKVEKTATPAYTRTYDWTIDKSVDPASHTLFDGQTGDSTYTIKVDKTTTNGDYAVAGNITVTNPATIPATVSSVTDSMTGGIDATVDCPSSTVAAGGSLVCAYTAALPNDDTRTNTATVTAYGVDYTGTASVDFSGVTPTTVGPASINVDDTFAAGDKGPIADDTTYTYKHTFDCSDISYTDGSGSKTVENTARITETGAKDSASVDVTCYRLGLAKTAATSFNRAYSWEIAKTGSTSSETVLRGTPVTVNYTVTVTKHTTDSGWAVKGDITISNPASMDATLTSVSDDISSLSPDPTPDCPSMTVPAGGKITCSYTTDLPNANARTNTATVVAYGVTYTATADIDFSKATVKESGDNSIHVTDTYAGALGTTDASKTYTYSRTIDTSALACNTYKYPNTAAITETGQSADWNVDVTVTGCGGNLFHTGTTCQQYLGTQAPDGLAGTQITQVQYSLKGNKINQVNPGVFFYYSTLTADAKTMAVLVDQTITHASFKTPFDPQNLANIRVYDADCNNVSGFTATFANGDVNLNLTGLTPGNDYIISVKYSTGFVVGQTKPTPATVHYDFATKVGSTVVDSDEDGLDLVKK